MMKILVIAEHNQTELRQSTYHTLAAAAQLGTEIDMLVIGNNCQSVAEQALQFSQIKRVLVADAIEYAHQLPENSATLVANLATNYTHILTSATTFGKNLLPRVAALLDMAMISDVVKIVEPEVFVRPIYAGNALATVKATDIIKLMTIRSTAFTPVALSQQKTASIHLITERINNELSEFESQELSVSSRPELTASRIIVAGGRGLKSAENFKLLEQLADLLGAAIGASRAAVDAGFAPNDYQVGQTGKIVAPDLYIAVGISGAIQHVAGMKDSKVIVAINNDPDAPIFQVADYGLVADLFTTLEELRVELNK